MRYNRKTAAYFYSIWTCLHKTKYCLSVTQTTYKTSQDQTFPVARLKRKLKISISLKSLRTLNISYNEIRQDGALAIAKQIITLPVFETINLNGNQLGEIGCELLRVGFCLLGNLLNWQNFKGYIRGLYLNSAYSSVQLSRKVWEVWYYTWGKLFQITFWKFGITSKLLNLCHSF